ncbi:Hsp70 family protein [Nocardia sp. 004]|uniref:Hsp70 family protein n=1 Tax=Nocardia sp. 004 TaxID=3385978 RepID=UPI00399FA499
MTEFADLTRRSGTRARVGNRALEPADLVATVVTCLIGEMLPDGSSRGNGFGATLTYPARYADEQVDALAAALDAVGLGQVAVVAEPVAAVTWLEAEHGPLPPGLVLVYDLGGAGLDVTVVGVGGADRSHPIMGVSLRSTEFGGRAFDAALAGYAGADPLAGAAQERVAGPRLAELRTRHIRDSLELVSRCLRFAQVTVSDIDCVLVVGGAARPAEVSRVLVEELARPVITAPDPGRTIADGAALIGRRAVVAAQVPKRPLRHGRARGHAAAMTLFPSRRTRRRWLGTGVAGGGRTAGFATSFLTAGSGIRARWARIGPR